MSVMKTKARGPGPLHGFGNANQVAVPAAPQVIPFSGTIAATTFDHKVAFVRVDEPAVREFAVVSPETAGCIALMNGHGRLEKNVKVTGTAELGGETLRAITVTVVPGSDH